MISNLSVKRDRPPAFRLQTTPYLQLYVFCCLSERLI